MHVKSKEEIVINTALANAGSVFNTLTLKKKKRWSALYVMVKAFMFVCFVIKAN